MPRKHRRITSLLLAVCGLLLLAMPASAFASGQHDSQHCNEKTLQVKLSAEDSQTYTLKGWLCWEGLLPGKTVQVLISGFTYDHHYWDFPFQSEKNSYVRKATDDGYATFNIDRIGVGQSAHPADPSKVTVPAEAYVAYQVVQALRGGQVNHVPFKKVIGVGHSMGAAIWMIEASTMPGNGAVDGLILTDYLHQTNPATQAALQAARIRAQEDPKFQNAGLPEGYFTTRSGMRYLYYNPAFVDPQVLATDEQLKQTATLGEGITINEARNPIYTGNIKVPTLVVVGEKDSLFCDEATGISCADKAAVMAREGSLYNTEACMEAYVLPTAGHDTNLHYNAKTWFKEAGKWADRKVGSNLWRSPSDPC